MLPPYVEFVKRRRDFGCARSPSSWQRSLGAPREHLDAASREPIPFERFSDALHARPATGSDGASIDTLPRYSFATLRQFGACFELAATYSALARQPAA